MKLLRFLKLCQTFHVPIVDLVDEPGFMVGPQAEAEGTILEEGMMKGGSTKLTLLREIPLPTVTKEQRIRYGILCAMEVETNEPWKLWASKWLSGEDRTVESAWAAVAWAARAERAAEAAAERAARAARAAGKTLDLIALAKKAVAE